ncbi:MAG: DUF72 domain-containing protein [Candidatus Abyssubacteria bacterium]
MCSAPSKGLPENTVTTTKVGCCGFAVAKSRYFAEFEAVEIQRTFYDLPRLSTAEKWRCEAPEGFEYTSKAWQLITHEPSSPTYRRLKSGIEERKKKRYGSFKPTDEVMEAWTQFLRFTRALGAGKVIFQCPAGFSPSAGNKKNMRAFFSSIDRTGLVCIWEPRGDWKREEIRELCVECSLVHCVDPFKSKSVADSIQYFRLHGISGYRYRYDDADLDTLLGKLDLGRLAYVMFNNVSMFEDARRFKRLLPARKRQS